MKTFQEYISEAEYQGKKVELNNPFRTPDGPKKFSVYVKNEKGNVVKVNFGDPNMEIKRDDPKRRKPDISLAIKNLNWKPEYDLDQGLIDTIKYFKEINLIN